MKEKDLQGILRNAELDEAGKIDGIDYYSLADAMSHGFLGYNCRHRLVKYTKGMDMFKEYPPNQIDREKSRS